MINKRYRLLKEIGKGRSRVFLCSDNFLHNKKFAIKILASDNPVEIATFKNEFELLSLFDYPGIIKAFASGKISIADREDENDFNVFAGNHYLLLEYFEGFELQNLPGVLKSDVLESVILQIASVLNYIHQGNYIHGDIKPENFLANYRDGKVVLKLIDFGFARYYKIEEDIEIKGTPEYLAPEIIERDFVDHRSDLYSFGMLIYRLVYEKFPFDNRNELLMYKAHLEKEFDFPPAGVNEKIINIAKQLLSKKPIDRPYLSLNILAEININIDENIGKYFIPPSAYVKRKNIIEAMRHYLDDEKLGEILILRGEKGYGKTTFLRELTKEIKNSIFISFSNSSNINFWKIILIQVAFENYLYENFSEELLSHFNYLIKNDVDDLKRLKSFFYILTREFDLTFIVDDANAIDDRYMETFVDIVQIIQAANSKTILVEETGLNNIAGKLSNVSILNFTPFSKEELTRFIDISFAGFFPKDSLADLAGVYSDLTPSGFYFFYRRLIETRILQFTTDGAKIVKSKNMSESLGAVSEKLYQNKIEKLSGDQLLVAQFFSVFKRKADEEIICSISGFSMEKVMGAIQSLRTQNIFLSEKESIIPEFTSILIKEYIYKSISNPKELHERASSVLEAISDPVYYDELAYQFEKSEQFGKFKEIILTIINSLEKGFALKYKIEKLNSLLNLPLSEKEIDEIRFLLIENLTIIGDFTQALNNFKDLNVERLSDERKIQSVKMNAKALIETGKISEGIEKLEEIKNLSPEEDVVESTLLIAGAEIDNGRYDDAREKLERICFGEFKDEFRAEGFNLLALLEIYQNYDLKKSAGYFRKSAELYDKVGNQRRIADVSLNLGNIFSMLSDNKNAVKYWNKASELNAKIGNLELEAKLMLNFGINNFGENQFESSINNYKKALGIFKSIGKHESEGSCLVNLGEVYSASSEFQEAFNALEEAKSIFINSSYVEATADCLFHFCKLYYYIGASDKFNSEFNEFSRFINNNNLKSIFKNKELALEVMSLDSAEADFKQLNSIYENLTDFEELESKRLKIESLFILARAAYENKKYGRVLKLLTEPLVGDLFEANNLWLAEKEYYFGKLYGKVEYDGINTAIAHFNNAYKLIENENIARISYLVLFELTLYYHSRGKYKEYASYARYTNMLIHYIADLFEDKILKSYFLEKKEIANILSRLKRLEEQENR